VRLPLIEVHRPLEHQETSNNVIEHPVDLL